MDMTTIEDTLEYLANDLMRVSETLDSMEITDPKYEMLVNRYNALVDRINNLEKLRLDNEKTQDQLIHDRDKLDREIAIQEKKLDLDQKRFKFDKWIKPISTATAVSTAAFSGYKIWKDSEDTIKRLHDAGDQIIRKEDSDEIKHRDSAISGIWKSIIGFIQRN